MCLYCSIRLFNDSVNAPPAKRQQSAGLRIWQTVTTSGVIVLKKNYRAVDKSLQETLNRIRVAQTTMEDLKKLRTRVLGSPNGPNMNEARWKTAMLVTPRNVIRQAWNHQASLRHMEDTGQQMFISPAIDEHIPRQQRDRVIWENDSKTEMLATWNLLCIGGPVVGTSNLAVELGIANGTRATIKQVVPHPDDTIGWYQANHEPIVILSRPPICVWIEVTGFGNKYESKSNNPSLYPFSSSREHDDWFSVLPLKCRIGLEKPKLSFKRTQIPLTPGTQFV